MNEELQWKHGRRKENECGPWLRASSPRQRPNMSRGWYSDDSKFHELEPSQGIADF